MTVSSLTVVLESNARTEIDRVELLLPKAHGKTKIVVEYFALQTPEAAKCGGLAKTLEDCLKNLGFTIKTKEMDGGSIVNATITR